MFRVVCQQPTVRRNVVRPLRRRLRRASASECSRLAPVPRCFPDLRSTGLATGDAQALSPMIWGQARYASTSAGDATDPLVAALADGDLASVLRQLGDASDDPAFSRRLSTRWDELLAAGVRLGNPGFIVGLLQLFANAYFGDESTEELDKVLPTLSTISDSLMRAKQKLLENRMANYSLSLDPDDVEYLWGRGLFLCKSVEQHFSELESGAHSHEDVVKLLASIEYSADFNEPEWGLMLRALESGRDDEARVWMRKLVELGVTPSLPTYLSLYCIHLGAMRMKKAKNVLNHMKRQGMEPEKVLSRLSFWPGKMMVAEHVKSLVEQQTPFEEVMSTLTFLHDWDKLNFSVYFDALAQSLAKAGKFFQISDAVAELNEYGVPVSKEIAMSLLQAYALSGDLRCLTYLRESAVAEGLLTLAESEASYLRCAVKADDVFEAEKAIKNLVRARSLSPEDVRLALSVYGPRGDMVRAQNLLRWMRKIKVSRSVEVYNGVLNILRKSGRREEVESLFAEMEADGFKPDSVTYYILMQMYVDLHDVDAVDALIKRMKKEGRTLAAKFQLQMYELVKAQTSLRFDLDYVETTFSMVHRLAKGDLSVYKRVFKKYLRTGGRPERAEEFVDLMLEAGVELDLETCGILASHLLRTDNPRRALRWVSQMHNLRSEGKGGVYSELFELNLALAVCERLDDLENLEEILSKMKAKGIVPDKNTYIPVVVSYAKSGFEDSVMELMSQMDDEGIRLDVVDYNRLLDGFVRSEKFQLVRKLLEKMKAEKVVFNETTFSHLTMMHALLGQPMNLSMADELLKEVTARGMKPLPSMMIHLLNLASALGEANKVGSYLELANSLSYQDQKAIINRQLTWLIENDDVDGASKFLRAFNSKITCSEQLLTKATRTLLKEAFQTNNMWKHASTLPQARKNDTVVAKPPVTFSSFLKNSGAAAPSSEQNVTSPTLFSLKDFGPENLQPTEVELQSDEFPPQARRQLRELRYLKRKAEEAKAREMTDEDEDWSTEQDKQPSRPQVHVVTSFASEEDDSFGYLLKSLRGDEVDKLVQGDTM